MYNISINGEQAHKFDIQSNKENEIWPNEMTDISNQCTCVTTTEKLSLQPSSSVRLTLCMSEVKDVKLQICDLSVRKCPHYNKI